MGGKGLTDHNWGVGGKGLTDHSWGVGGLKVIYDRKARGTDLPQT